MADENWTTMRFDDFVERVNETVMPTESDLDRYIGLEHLDTMDLTIRRWDEGRNLIGQKLLVLKGDIIIARRNWYLRRVAIAPFDALCSAHAMIIRPKKDVINPDYLACFLLSDQFYQRAVEISVGSLSPTINWSTLKTLEFSLPPPEVQNQIAILAQSSRKLHNLYHKSEEQMSVIYQMLLSKEFCYSLPELKSCTNKRGVEFLRLGDLAEISLSNVNKKSVENEEVVRLCNYMDVYSNIYITDQEGYMQSTASQTQIDKFTIRENDILLTKDSETPDDIGVPAMVKELTSPLVCGYHLAVIRVNSDKINAKYLFHFIRSKLCRAYFKMLAQGSTRFSLGKDVFINLPIPIPEMSRQINFVRMIDNVDIDSMTDKPSINSSEICKIVLRQSSEEVIF